MHKVYLGDAVYIEHDSFGVILTTEDDGPIPSNKIYMEPQVLRAFIRYYEMITATNYKPPNEQTY
jgi:hypothetical protein